MQGEFGAVFYMVDYCFKTGRIPVYAATKRVVQEHKNGDKITSKRVFEHTCFRRYQRFK
ncbi:MAG: CRISPR-associated protein Csx20 [Desulfotomaculum sp.]|nr:CRISPR-associated protein Csx20 [Desulfotomaculum sp.]